MPSLSGRVFEEGNDFEKKLTSYRESGDNKPGFRFRVAPPSDCDMLATVNAVLGDDLPDGDILDPMVVVIDIIDKGGLCRISSVSGGFNELRDAWSAFRNALDGCSDTEFDCSSMRLPIRVEASEDQYDALARKMLDSVEANVDMIAYVAGNAFKWTKKENPVCFARADCDANALYFSAFMDLYKDKFKKSDCWDERVAEMKRRVDKLNMACRLVDGRETHWFNRTSVILSRSAVIIAIIAVVITLFCRRMISGIRYIQFYF